jgi:rod shape-determining protein MreD
MNSANGLMVVAATIFVALLLNVLPLPQWAQWGRPAMVEMVLIYWVIAVPERIGVGMAWMLGLLQDVVQGAMLGQNAFALAIITYLALILYQRMRMYTPLQQASVVFILIGLKQLLCHWLQTLTGTVSPSMLFLLPALVSALLWPLLALVLRLLRRAYYVH